MPNNIKTNSPGTRYFLEVDIFTHSKAEIAKHRYKKNVKEYDPIITIKTIKGINKIELINLFINSL